MIMRAALVAASLLPAIAPAAPAARPDAVNGKAVFQKWCAPCHAANPKLAGTLALQAKYKGAMPAALEQRTDLTPELVGYFVRTGVAWMAPFRKTEISDAELADLGAYLSVNRTGVPAKRRGK